MSHKRLQCCFLSFFRFCNIEEPGTPFISSCSQSMDLTQQARKFTYKWLGGRSTRCQEASFSQLSIVLRVTRPKPAKLRSLRRPLTQELSVIAAFNLCVLTHDSAGFPPPRGDTRTVRCLYSSQDHDGQRFGPTHEGIYMCRSRAGLTFRVAAQCYYQCPRSTPHALRTLSLLVSRRSCLAPCRNSSRARSSDSR